MIITAVMNLKGGVGKTVTAINLAYNLVRDHGAKVLFIDADAQANATEFFSIGVESHSAPLYRILTDAPTRVPLFPGKTAYEEIGLISSSDDLSELDLSLLKMSDSSLDLSRLRRYVLASDPIACDVCIIDCPPAFSAASAAALMAANNVIIPIKLDAFALQGMASIKRQIDSMRIVNPTLRIAGILPTMYSKSRETDSALTQLHDSGLPIYLQTIRMSSKVDASTFAQEPLRLFSPRCAAGVDYRRFAEIYWEELHGF